MLDTHKGKRFCSCDSCGNELITDKGNTFLFASDEFDVFLERLEEAGWKAVKTKHNIWEHYCGNCQ